LTSKEKKKDCLASEKSKENSQSLSLTRRIEFHFDPAEEAVFKKVTFSTGLLDIGL
jgi:hypothetical protein